MDWLPTSCSGFVHRWEWPGQPQRKIVTFPRFAALSVWLTLNASPLQDLDAGTFLFEMAGHRWATDLGADSYGLSGYWSKSSAHGNRYSYCTCSRLLLHPPARTVRAPVAWLERPHPTLRPDRKSTRGHNTLTVK